MKRIQGITAERNITSRRALQKAGFVKQREQMMDFQETAQAVIVFEYSSR